MAISKENSEKLRKAMREHKERMDRDPEFRKECEERQERYAKIFHLTPQKSQRIPRTTDK